MAAAPATNAKVQLAVTAILILLAAAALPPDFDETYYWAWSRSLAWSYYDHPPGIAWVLRVATALFGDGILGVRSVALGSSAIVVLCSVASVQRLVSPEHRVIARELAVFSLLGAPMFVLGYLPATPDPLQGAAVALAAYLVVRAGGPLGQGPLPAFLAGFALSAGVLIKHTTGFLALGALPFAFALPAARRPAPWLGVALGSLLLVPWLLSDPSTVFQLDRVITSAPRGPLAIPLTVGAMLGTLGPATALGLLVLPFVRLQPVERVLAGGAGALILACVAAVWFGTGEANWPMPAMVFALPALVGFVVRRGGRLLRAVRATARITAVLMMVALLHVLYPFLPFPPAKDRTLRSAGFAEVAAAARDTAARIGAHTVIARRYQIASELRYHLQDELTVHELGTSRRSQYDRWPHPPLCRGEPAVLVLPFEGVPPELAADPLGPARPVERRRAGRFLDTYFVTPIRIRADRGACP